MEKETNSDNLDELTLDSEISAFIEEQLTEKKPDELKKVFSPLTDGLGLDSPKAEDLFFASETQKKSDPIEQEEVIAKIEKPKIDTKSIIEEELNKKTEKPKEVEPEVEQLKLKKALDPNAAPPPLPELAQASWMRRLLGGLTDQLFVITLWSVSMVITVKALSGLLANIIMGESYILKSDSFLQFAVLEFAAIWFCYFAICFGILNMTFGMWVWGLRADFKNDEGETSFVRKLFRMTFSFIICAPILPALILLAIISKNGKNLIDFLSGSRIYQAAQ